jgi:hypothetical protein
MNTLRLAEEKYDVQGKDKVTGSLKKEQKVILRLPLLFYI